MPEGRREVKEFCGFEFREKEEEKKDFCGFRDNSGTDRDRISGHFDCGGETENVGSAEFSVEMIIYRVQ